jgi:hypothetical protein
VGRRTKLKKADINTKGNALKKQNKDPAFIMLVKPMPEPGDGGYLKESQDKMEALLGRTSLKRKANLAGLGVE